MALLREIDRRQTPMADGCRSLVEWVTGRLDLAPDTAKTLVTAAHRCEWLPSVEVALADGVVSYDRVVAAARMAEPSHDGDILDKVAHHDVAGIGHLVARRRRMSTGREREASEHRYVVAQPNLDESSWQIRGQLPATAGRVFVAALDERADVLPANPSLHESRSTRWADALWAISLDSIAGGDGASIDTSKPLLTVFLDATEAAPTNGEAGAMIEAGPRVGPNAVEAILCDGIIEVTARAQDGTPLQMGRRGRIIPPRLRRFVLHRDGAVCTIEGCTSRYRLQIHHIHPWSQGGRTDAENLTTLCRFHHHIVIHGQGFTIDPSSPPQRRRLFRTPIHAPPDHHTPERRAAPSRVVAGKGVEQ